MKNKARRLLTLGLTSSLAAFAGIVHSAVSSYANGQFYSVPPDLQQSIPPNVLLNLSVETPMGGAAYNDHLASSAGCTGRPDGTTGTCFNPDNTYIGYFDPTKCYEYHGEADRFFDQVGWHAVSAGMDSKGADSYEPTGEGAPNGWPDSAFDGNVDTIWHTEWKRGCTTSAALDHHRPWRDIERDRRAALCAKIGRR